LLLAVGGYRKTDGEDMDLVVRLHRHCVDQSIEYEVGFIPEPVCWTQVPGDLRSLLLQRNRWQRGLFDSLWHNRSMLLNSKYGLVGTVGFPYFVLVELLGPAIEFMGYLGFVVFTLLGWINWPIALLFFTLAVLLGMWLNAAAVLIDNLLLHRYRHISDVLRIALLGSLEFLGMRQLIAIERLIGTFQITKSHWGKAKREAIEHSA
jgi:cellulose synthase/poly-beta-1,6-N-acetylglucosamine synthase-like glycosyltransferase